MVSLKSTNSPGHRDGYQRERFPQKGASVVWKVIDPHLPRFLRRDREEMVEELIPGAMHGTRRTLQETRVVLAGRPRMISNYARACYRNTVVSLAR